MQANHQLQINVHCLCFSVTPDYYVYICSSIYISVAVFIYGTDLTQRRTPSRVLGYHSRATRTRSSICIIGLELAVVLALERKMVRAVLKLKNDTNGA